MNWTVFRSFSLTLNSIGLTILLFCITSQDLSNIPIWQYNKDTDFIILLTENKSSHILQQLVAYREAHSFLIQDTGIQLPAYLELE